MNVLIAGGTGLIGSRLCQLLIMEGHSVGILTRNIPKNKATDIQYFKWNPNKHEMDVDAMFFADAIVNLAGASIVGKKWNEEYKKEIINSRVDATKTIVDYINTDKYKVKTLVNASAIGYYGFDNTQLVDENSPPTPLFLSQVCVKWEEEAEKLNPNICKLIIERIGIVLSTKDGALKEILAPMKFGFGTCLGSGKQMTSWIHIDDLCKMMIWATEKEDIKGVYLGCAPYPETNKELTKKAAKILKKPLWIPNVPGFVLYWMLGEAAGAVVGSINSPGNKSIKDGFVFDFPNLKEALEDIILRKV